MDESGSAAPGAAPRVAVEPNTKTMRGLTVERVERIDGALVVYFDNGVTLYADDPALYLTPGTAVDVEPTRDERIAALSSATLQSIVYHGRRAFAARALTELRRRAFDDGEPGAAALLEAIHDDAARRQMEANALAAVVGRITEEERTRLRTLYAHRYDYDGRTALLDGLRGKEPPTD